MKILILGLDGVDPEILRQFMDAGKLPNFSKLREEGVFSPMASIVPIITPVAWTSMLTGKNPGKHGIGGFAKYKPHSYHLKILSSLDRKSETLWHVLNRHKISVGIFNYPSLYPPENIDKLMVCGMLTPNIKCTFTYPTSLQREILDKVTDYDIDVRIVKAAEDRMRLLEDIYKLSESRFTVADYLMDKYPCDVFIFVLTETDRILHYFIRDLKYGFSQENSILKYFQYLDNKLGTLISKIDEDTILFLVSDHGMCEVHKTIYVNNWLRQQGLLEINTRSLSSAKHTYTRGFIQWLSRLFLRFNISIERIKDYLPERLSNFLTFLYCYYGGIDWSKTKAYFSLGAGLSITINRKDIFPKGIVDENEYEPLRGSIISGLQELRDPQNNSRIIERVYRREELFRGDHLCQMPDLILKFSEGYVPAESTLNDSILEDLNPREFLRSEHRLEGIFFAYNKKYIRRSSNISGVSILDIAPTIFYALGIPIPEDCDGRPLQEIFNYKTDVRGKPGVVNLRDDLRKKIRELKLAGKIK